MYKLIQVIQSQQQVFFLKLLKQIKNLGRRLMPGGNVVRATAQLRCSPTLALPIAAAEAEDADTVIQKQRKRRRQSLHKP